MGVGDDVTLVVVVVAVGVVVVIVALVVVSVAIVDSPGGRSSSNASGWTTSDVDELEHNKMSGVRAPHNYYRTSANASR